MTGDYGAAPVPVGTWTPDWSELMHWMYLPVRMDGSEIRLPANLEFARSVVELAVDDATGMGRAFRYVYLTARRGWASPGNPLNRPGWHTDGFGTPDLNYVWTDRWPTSFATHPFTCISDDHVESLRQFEGQARCTALYPDRVLLRLDRWVVHAAPAIPAPGGMRSFLKVSLSDDRYNLTGNSHNHEFAYDWPMFDREAVRNDPAFAGGDAGPQPAGAR